MSDKCVICGQRPKRRNSSLCAICFKRPWLEQIAGLMAYLGSQPKMLYREDKRNG